ncbi:hypothetical protein CDL12_18539 [Handroanthus impetiginosus]|uniref:Uncharacterized protein n=1 Tax=Handroanthus impetiginosus TaxID=429701 RepID=A0A2G9GUK4_9LAMI|nr:hypothetical protein CDL12_18539 [Handroanthus impetiginosus]
MEHNFNLKEWSLKAEISCENRKSRRLSGSILRTSREEERSFRSNVTISSTSSSPGYTVREEIDPSTYSFTTALKALQAKTVYAWEYISPDGGLTLNSKWNDAEKYISNPLSGEVPLECLSAKTLSGRSLGGLTRGITMSAPLIYSAQLQHQFQTKIPVSEKDEVKITVQERKKSTTRDVGIQSNLSSRSPSPSPAPTPSIEERPRKLSVGESADSSVSSAKLKSEAEVEEARETKEKEKYTKRNEGRDRKKAMCRCIKAKGQGGGCLPFKGLLWHNKDKHKTRKTNPNPPTVLYHINACYKE